MVDYCMCGTWCNARWPGKSAAQGRCNLNQKAIEMIQLTKKHIDVTIFAAGTVTFKDLLASNA
jgi:hypothetical protein